MPGLPAIQFQEALGAIALESNALASAVAVCGIRSLLTQVIRWPVLTVKLAGLNCTFSITTTWDWPAAGNAGPDAETPDNPKATIAMLQISSGGSCTAFAQGALQLFGMIEVSHERRSNFDQQRFEFGVLSAGN